MAVLAGRFASTGSKHRAMFRRDLLLPLQYVSRVVVLLPGPPEDLIGVSDMPVAVNNWGASGGPFHAHLGPECRPVAETSSHSDE